MDFSDWCYPWNNIICIPYPGRTKKPRTEGITMVIDKGMGYNETSEFLNVNGRYVDYLKLAFGTSALYDENLLKKKIKLIRSHGVQIYPGGTFLEIAVFQNKTKSFLNRAWELGFSAIEISDGTINLPLQLRQKIIRLAVETGFEVLTEVGKKEPSQEISAETIIEQIKSDLDAGAHKVIIEARESGKGIGIYDEDGKIKKAYFEYIVGNIPSPDFLIWESPLKSQQQELIMRFGPNVNLGNIPPSDVLALEALRQGLRGDTFKTVLELNMQGCVTC